ncbi:hypothetical protein BH23BAC4_BH23BAC4_02510 [soil metagenome]
MPLELHLLLGAHARNVHPMSYTAHTPCVTARTASAFAYYGYWFWTATRAEQV